MPYGLRKLREWQLYPPVNSACWLYSFFEDHAELDYDTDVHARALLRLPTVLERVPVGRATWWRGVKSRRFPAPQRISARCVAWRESDIVALIVKDDLQGRWFEHVKKDAGTIRRGMTLDLDQLRARTRRRHLIWYCAQLTNLSPSATARKYAQLTGETISRQVVANQLEKIEEVLPKKGLKLLVRA
jgi:prophage regulatory protein